MRFFEGTLIALPISLLLWVLIALGLTAFTDRLSTGDFVMALLATAAGCAAAVLRFLVFRR